MHPAFTKKTIICPNCGSQNKLFRRYCAVCFQELSEPEGPLQIELNSRVHRVKNINKIMLLAIALLIGLILLLK